MSWNDLIFKLNLTGNYSIRMTTTVTAFTILEKRKKKESNKLFHFKEEIGQKLIIKITYTAVWNLIIEIFRNVCAFAAVVAMD